MKEKSIEETEARLMAKLTAAKDNLLSYLISSGAEDCDIESMRRLFDEMIEAKISLDNYGKWLRS